jgi:hypothetical protein
MNDIKVLLEFLNMPLDGTGEIFAKFQELEGAVRRGEGAEQFLYRPGSRKDRVLLVAHADTVFRSGGRQEIVQEDGIIRKTRPGDGL